MLIRFLKGNHLLGLLFIPVLAIILWYTNFQADIDFNRIDLPLYKSLISFIKYPFLVDLLALLLIISQAFYLLYINRIYNFISHRTHLTSIFYILITCALPPFNNLQPAIIANSFILPMLVQIFSTYKQQKISRGAFNTGMLISLASLFYFKTVLLIPFVYLSFIILNHKQIRGFLALTLGIVLPYWIAFLGLLYFDKLAMWESLFPPFFAKASIINLSLSYCIFAFILGVMILISIWNISAKYSNKKISTRTYFGLFIILFAFTLFIFILSNFKAIDILIIASIPITYLVSNYLLNNQHKKIQNIIFYTFIFSIILLRVY